MLESSGDPLAAVEDRVGGVGGGGGGHQGALQLVAEVGRWTPPPAGAWTPPSAASRG